MISGVVVDSAATFAEVVVSSIVVEVHATTTAVPNTTMLRLTPNKTPETQSRVPEQITLISSDNEHFKKRPISARLARVGGHPHIETISYVDSFEGCQNGCRPNAGSDGFYWVRMSWS